MTSPTLAEAAPHAAGIPAAATPAPRLPAKVLSFRLGGEPYAIDILAVREIRSFEPPTSIPGAGAELRGLIDLRGTVVPVLDLRLRVGHPRSGLPEAGAVIVIERESRLVGAIVDAVEDVQELQAGQLRPVPMLASSRNTAPLLALAHIDGRLVQLLDIGRLLDTAPRSAAAH